MNKDIKTQIEKLLNSGYSFGEFGTAFIRCLNSDPNDKTEEKERYCTRFFKEGSLPQIIYINKEDEHEVKAIINAFNNNK